jgi:hypothetical protein
VVVSRQETMDGRAARRQPRASVSIYLAGPSAPDWLGVSLRNAFNPGAKPPSVGSLRPFRIQA